MERTLDSAAHLQRVCRAWHSASEVQGLAPGVRAAEGEEQGQGVTARRGLTAAHAKEAGRRPGPGSGGGGPPRDERARDRDALQARWGVREPSGADASPARCLPPGALPGARREGCGQSQRP
jgi:hypothetical protein